MTDRQDEFRAELDKLSDEDINELWRRRHERDFQAVDSGSRAPTFEGATGESGRIVGEPLPHGRPVDGKERIATDPILSADASKEFAIRETEGSHNPYPQLPDIATNVHDVEKSGQRAQGNDLLRGAGGLTIT